MKKRYNSNDLICLEESLYYLNVNELKHYCFKLELSVQGKKAVLVKRIVHFLATGEKLVNPQYPKNSCSVQKQGVLKPEALMLKGSYKNDLKTRLFFKALIGEHFHFTAFGIDWLDERWLAGNPPTYQEFAGMWQEQYKVRQYAPVAAKTEWAFIRFVQAYLQKHQATKEELHSAWFCEREKHVHNVQQFFNKFFV